MFRLTGITIFPIKSLPGISVEQSRLLAGGALEFDRQFALVDELGRMVNGKRHAAVHRLRGQVDFKTHCVTLRSDRECRSVTFQIVDDRTQLESWLSAFFTFPVRWVENATHGFPDDSEAPGPTLVGLGTLREVATWFPGLHADDIGERLRANLTFDGEPAFFEDQLFAESDSVVRFRVGDVVFEGVNPCRRCIVPTRDPANGDSYPNFAATLTRMREVTLPAWSARARFDTFYRLCVNTKPTADSAGGLLRVGDPLTIEGVFPVDSQASPST